MHVYLIKKALGTTTVPHIIRPCPTPPPLDAVGQGISLQHGEAIKPPSGVDWPVHDWLLWGGNAEQDTSEIPGGLITG